MKKIFIIEDDNILRENLESLLEIEGFKVFSSGLGKPGVELIKEIGPDLIICDIMLPDTDGYQIASEMKSLELTRNIPFIFLTAKSEMNELRSGMNLGADDYLTKPYDAKELINVVKMRISLSRLLPEPPENDESGDEISIDDNIFVKSSKQVKKIPVKSIVCIIAEAEYTYLHTEENNKILVRKLIKTWENLLPVKNFVRIHKSTIINLSFLLKIETWFNNSFKIYLNKYPEPLISSRRYSSKLRSKLLT
jgi:DNA-binding LytR/AlgR family response regulator